METALMKNTIRMVALRPIYYDRDIQPDEEFDVSGDHVNPLLITGAAKLKEGESKKSKGYQRKDMRAED
jgi:hypothetical protein